MATAHQTQQSRPQQRAPTRSESLLDQILEQPVNERMAAVNTALEKRIKTVEEVLPESLKGQAERFVKRAELTFSRYSADPNKDLSPCTPQSIVRCVVEAAEIGLAIDGKLCHVLKYNQKIKSQKGEQDKWIIEAQLRIDYKGLIVVARRSGQIVDCYGDVVCEGDNFEAFRDGPNSVLKHSYEFGTKRGKVIGVYCVLTFPGGRWRYEMMNTDEIQKIRATSKAANNGPWVTFWDEMAKKTVARRALKLYCDDPAVGMALEIDEREYEGERSISAPTTRVGRSSLNDTLSEPVKTYDEKPNGRHLPVDAVDDSPADESYSNEAASSVDEQQADITAFLSACESAKDFPEILAAEETLRGEQGRDLTADEDKLVEQAKDAAAKRLNGKKGKPAQGSLV